MIYLTLFLTFFEIGLFTIGGGYAMIPIVLDAVVSKGWMTEAEFMNFLAVAESTPGPIAVNMATFIGSTQGGILGSALATLGVVLPSFIIILIIVAFVRNLFKYRGVQAVMSGIRPAVVALICATACTMILSTVLGVQDFHNVSAFDYRAPVIFAILAVINYLPKLIFKDKKKKLSPILLILISAGLGMVFYGLLG